MSLVQSIHLGGETSILTSDTRRVMQFGGIEIPFFSTESKLISLSPALMIGGAGADYMYDDFKRILNQSNPIYLDDVLELLKEAYLYIFEEYQNEFAKGDLFQFVVSGFMKNGKSGYFICEMYSPEYIKPESAIHYQEFKHLEIVDSTFCPDIDAYMKARSKFSEVETKETNSFLSEALQHLANKHYYQYKKCPQSISEVFMYKVITRDRHTKQLETLDGIVNLKKTKGVVEIG